MITPRHLLFAAAATATAVVVPAGLAGAASQSPSTGQPGAATGAGCAATPNATAEPGNSASSPGSPFNEPTATSSGGTAGGMYAGNGAGSVNHANSSAAQSQYDVACVQLTQH